MKLKIRGMHCVSCASLIKMKLEEKGYGDNIDVIEILEDNIGTLTLKNITGNDSEKIREIIESMDNYSILKVKE